MTTQTADIPALIEKLEGAEEVTLELNLEVIRCLQPEKIEALECGLLFRYGRPSHIDYMGEDRHNSILEASAPTPLFSLDACKALMEERFPEWGWDKTMGHFRVFKGDIIRLGHSKAGGPTSWCIAMLRAMEGRET